ncbi:tripartite tricarboxylate transporter substrate binding protein BugE [soil metagenome]
MKLMSRLLSAAALTAAMCLQSVSAAYPDKAVSFVVPFPPGGRTDLVGRLFAQHVAKHLGQPAVVVNKAGAGGVLGAREVAVAAPDGYTLGVFSTATLTSQYTVPTPTDLGNYEAVGVINLDPMALAVNADGPWKRIEDLVDYARKNPGKLRVGMIPGASAQIFAAAFANAAGVKVLYVPFKGDSDGAAALAGGHIDAHVAVPASYKALSDAGKVKMLAVASDARLTSYRDVPTFRESGVDLVIGSFHIVCAPKGTPPEVLKQLEEATGKTMREPELMTLMESSGLGYANMNRKDTNIFLGQQDAVYRKVIDDVGLRVSPQTAQQK